MADETGSTNRGLERTVRDKREKGVKGGKVVTEAAVTTFPPFTLSHAYLRRSPLNPHFVLLVSPTTSPSFPLSHFSSSSLAGVVPLHPYLGL